MRLHRYGVWGAACVSAGAAMALATPAWAVEPHRSMTTLSSSNGLGALVYDATKFKITEFLEHPYQAASSTTTSRNFAFDSYPGIRIGTTGTWLTSIAPSVIEYLPATGIIHTQRSFSGLTIDEYDFAPMTLTQNASVMLVKVTQPAAGGPTTSIDLYSIFNYSVGSGTPPSQDGETVTYDASRDAYYESGASGIAMAFASISPSTFHGSSPNNPYTLLTAGSNLQDDASSGGAVTSAAEGFQSSAGVLAPGASAWAGWVTVLAPDANGANAVDTMRTWLAGRAPAKVLSDELAGWASWIKPAPAGASATEAALHQQSQAMIRMGQVTESGPGNGQILAAVTPGEWNISWVRDMAYATVALVKSGHQAEAKAALAFQMNASVGSFQMYVGSPYQISVCRYYGNGSEWSDSNSDGPNVEFDGFGLFLWALDAYVTTFGDTATLATWWPTIKSKVGDVLVSLQEASGMIEPDSSIWEVHWDGQQRHFAYTTASAANGLCSASTLATKVGDTTSAATYLSHGAMARDALLANMRGASGALGQSTEAIAGGVDWLDASPIEAFNWGLLDPKGHTASATMSSMLASLVPPSGRGFMRDQTGAYYDSQEWVFIDLRSEHAFELAGNTTFSSSLFGWNTAQGSDNFNEMSELHDATTADYAGASPMVGFGSGAYIVSLTDRGSPVKPVCGAFAAESADGGIETVDAGMGIDATSPTDASDASSPVDATAHPPHFEGGALDDAGAPGDARGIEIDASVTTTPKDAGRGGSTILLGDAGTGGQSSSGGCAVSANGAGSAREAWSFLPLLALGLLKRKKRA